MNQSRAKSWSEAMGQKRPGSQYASTLNIRGEPMAMPKDQRPKAAFSVRSITGFMMRSLNDVTGVKDINSVKLQSNQLSSFLKDVSQSRTNLHDTVMSMKCGSGEWQELQAHLRKTKAVTNLGLAVAMNCHWVDESIGSNHNYVAKDHFPNVSEARNRTRRLSAPPTLHSRGHFIHRSSLKKIKQKSSSERFLAKSSPTQNATLQECWQRIATPGGQNRSSHSRKGQLSSPNEKPCELECQENVSFPVGIETDWKVVERRSSWSLSRRRGSLQNIAQRVSSSMSRVSLIGSTSNDSSVGVLKNGQKHNVTKCEEESSGQKNFTYLPFPSLKKQRSAKAIRRSSYTIPAEHGACLDADASDFVEKTTLCRGLSVAEAARLVAMEEFYLSNDEESL